MRSDYEGWLLSTRGSSRHLPSDRTVQTRLNTGSPGKLMNVRLALCGHMLSRQRTLEAILAGVPIDEFPECHRCQKITSSHGNRLSSAQ